MTVKKLYEKLTEKIPEHLSCEWDNDGIMCSSDFSAEVNNILITLDVTEEIVDYAIGRNFDLIISHHPLIFKPIGKVTEENHGRLANAIATIVRLPEAQTGTVFHSKREKK